MTLSPWLALLLAVPVLVLGELLVKRITVLSRLNIPAPVVGGLLVAGVILLGNLSGAFPARFESKVTAPWWTWLVTIEPEWVKAPAKGVSLPLLVTFFCCIGLNASWSLVRRGTVQILVFLAICTVLAVGQNFLGVIVANWMGYSPLLGVACGSVTLTGGHGTALGFAADLEKAGLHGAAAIGAAAATFGVIGGALLGGPLGGGLIQRFALKSTAPASTHLELGQAAPSGIISDVRAAVALGKRFLLHVLLVAVCVKLGAWVSYWMQRSGLTFPVYIGAMLVGVTLRNVLELLGKRWVQTETIDLVASIALGIFLSVAMMSLNLIELASAALPMLVILVLQVALVAAFAWWVSFRLLGRDFDSAVMASGLCGFGLGATPNAVATMKALVERFGPAPRAFLVVPVVGAFLIDLVNAVNITVFLNVFGDR